MSNIFRNYGCFKQHQLGSSLGFWNIASEDWFPSHHIPVRFESSPKAQPERLQYVSWLRDTTSLLIIFNNDIYYRHSPEDETNTRLTFTGQPDVVFNGVPDWLYQEDVLQSQEALWPSYDGTHLLYATFNDTEVGILNFPWFQTEAVLAGGKASNRPMLFPGSKSIRYPTPGTPIPQVQLWVLDISNLTNLENYQVMPPNALEGQDYYMTSAGWIGQKNTEVSVVWINRAQNLSIVSACLAPNWTCIESHTERSLERAWLEVQEHPIFSPDGDSFLMLAHVQEGRRETYTHIKHITVTQQHIAVLSHGPHEISPQSDNYRAPFYVLQCEGPGLPLAGMHNSTSHKLLKILYDTRIGHGVLLQDLAMPKKRSFEVPLPQGSLAEVQLLLPPSWREELRDAAYPVVVEVNGRPGSKSVTEKFVVDWATFMSSHCDVVYIKLDVRGSRGRADKALYRQLGGIEVQDQISAIDYLLNKDHKYHKYLDKTRIGIWGWGYGGYVTSMVLGMGNQQKVFKCGIAVNPITDWLYYNSAFTEKVLGLPTENYKGYVQADATQRAKNIPRKSFFLLHGMADLTAPYQHSVLLSRALAEHGVLFRYQSYPDEGHELSGVLEHVYSSMQNFFEECLKLDTEERELPATEDT
ncbi:hypothetical protein YQE_00752, partial [Dendroctonus ponderosae]